jgi:hypothetical protein
MNVSNVGNPVDAALNSISPVEDKRAALQVALLKKTLESQQQQAQELVRMMEGKGRVIDLRV